MNALWYLLGVIVISIFGITGYLTFYWMFCGMWVEAFRDGVKKFEEQIQMVAETYGFQIAMEITAQN